MLATWQRLTAFDENLRAKYGSVLCGCDEAGRGAWSGPIVAAAVILRPETVIPGINDSKKLSAEQREELVLTIHDNVVAYDIQFIEPEEIDVKGIQWANQQVMYRATGTCADVEPVDVYVIDQSPPFKRHPHVMMPKADGTSLAVAAASILAKTARDEHMKRLAQTYPEYHLEVNKGYPLPDHVEAVKAHGRIKGLHRYSWTVKGFNRPVQLSLFDMMEALT